MVISMPYNIQRAIAYHNVKVTEYRWGSYCQSTGFTGAGTTRRGAIQAWVQTVARTGAPGGFNERHAKKIAIFLLGE